MKRFYLNQNQFLTHTIDGDEFNHIKNVMRMNRGDEFIAFEPFLADEDFTVGKFQRVFDFTRIRTGIEQNGYGAQFLQRIEYNYVHGFIGHQDSHVIFAADIERV